MGGNIINKYMMTNDFIVMISLFADDCISAVDDSTEINEGSISCVNETEHTNVSNIEKNIGSNVLTSFNSKVKNPDIDPTAYIHPLASVIGNVHIGTNVMISPGASVRSDEGQPIHIGDNSNVQDGVVLHALKTDGYGKALEYILMEVDGEKYAVYVGNRVSVAHQSYVYGPAKVGDDTFIGMQSFVFKATVGNNCVLEPVCAVIGVTIPDDRYVPAGTIVTTQAQANALPGITGDYAYKYTNEAVVNVNEQLAKGYNEFHDPLPHICTNVLASFNCEVKNPDIDPTAYVHPQASVIGNVHIGTNVMISQGASVRGDEGQPIYIGDNSNIQDGVVLHALKTEEYGKALENNLIEVDDKKYAVYVGDRVSMVHQSHVHGPAKVGDDTFIGMQSFVFEATVGNNCVLEPICAVIGVTIPDGRYVPAGTVVTTQAQANTLPVITGDYAYKITNEAVVNASKQLAKKYNGQFNGD
ncbi:MAG: DapH/DapD/GlmU-related protein [Methanosarcinaceae archaeon]